MSGIAYPEIKEEFLKNKIGVIGIGILVGLVMLSVIAVITIPIDTFKQWNNPNNWISYPKTSVQIWTNYFMVEKIPEHIIMENPITVSQEDTVSVTSHQFNVNFDYDDFPNDFIYEFTTEYSGSPLLQMSIIRPDQSKILLLSTSLPYSETINVHHERFFSSDNIIKKNAQIQLAKINSESYGI